MPARKLIHFYWGRNCPLSFLRFMSVYSFISLNPDWGVWVWTPHQVSTQKPWSTGEQAELYVGHDHLCDLLGNTKIEHKPLYFSDISLTDDMPEVHKADLLRWFILGQYGGIWSDFDVLYINPITESIHNNMVGVGLCQYRAIPKQPLEYLAIGFMYAEGQSGKRFFNDLFTYGRDKFWYEPNIRSRYQAFGAELLKGYLEKYGSKVNFMDPRLVYPRFQHHQIKKYWSPEPCDLSHSIGCHWYGGMPESGVNEATVTKENLSEKAKIWDICRGAYKIWNL